MSAQLRQPVLPEAPAGIVPASLEQQILAAELAVIAREQRLRAQAAHIGQQLQQKSPALIAAGASMVGGVILRRVFRQRRHPVAASAAPATAPGSSGGGFISQWLMHLPWPQLGAMVWPMLPMAVRKRADPKLVAAVMATTVPLVVSRLRAPPRQTAPATVEALDLSRYAGVWFEVARLPLRTERDCAGDVSATYTLLRGGRMRVVNRCRTRDGGSEEVHGIARTTGGDDAKLEVCFAPRALRWMPGAWAPYWVLHVDTNYGAAVVGTPDRQHLWLLSRTPDMDDAQLQRLMLHARAQGFDTTRLLRTPQAIHHPQP
jgi:apolipoprotein D and lipocalin family protein